MYNYEWDPETGGYLLTTKITGVIKEVRPVFKEELLLLGFDRQFNWQIPDTDLPLMWAEGRRYIYRGECIGEAVGGGLFELPVLKANILDLKILPVDVERMIGQNRSLMNGLVQLTLKSIFSTYKKFVSQVDLLYVAFSGGKDSMVLLDLIQRALPHNDFEVVFGDTTMEFSDTYSILGEAQKFWPSLSWHIAKAHINAIDSWQVFGPPARTIRWCCSVHKTAPSILEIKQVLAKRKNKRLDEISRLRVLAFLGIRKEESEARSAYSLLADGNKHTIQINCNPILEWGTSELFLYILSQRLPLNKLYRYGSHRVGCKLCPLASSWYESITNHVREEEVKPFIDVIKKTIRRGFNDEKKWKEYLESGGWKQRASGKYLSNSEDKIIENISNDKATYIIRGMNYPWKTWLTPIGDVFYNGDDNYSIIYKDISVTFRVNESSDCTSITLTIPPKTKSSIRFMYLFRNALYKSAYCKNCKVCMVECKTCSLFISENEILFKNCIRCESCLDKRKGCLIASSVSTTGDGNMSKTNIDRYKNFGLRLDWVKIFMENPSVFWQNGRMGSHMLISFKAWGKESGLLDKRNNPLPITITLQAIDPDSPLLWSYLFVNLCYSSALFTWYVNHVSFGYEYKSNDLLLLLEDDYKGSSETTIKNALSSLKDTLKSSPIGPLLGQGTCQINGKVITTITRMGWLNPDPLAILYSLYKFAEISDNYFSFTLSDLLADSPERPGISPAKLFNISRETLQRMLYQLSHDHSDFIKVVFNKDLDNIYLNNEKTSLDVVELF
ncbi:phosphoadenosine phosphosulfate reductase domain-containing protein [Flexilinea flocculi]|uniref:3'-phosphoadenosine 5'-phosphosulfate sulfotransferase n=1 Tax=Flexilinea flocculi TaxID=1678840 RepID=A0A0S7BW32_9CHLR|nr:phosphoadenosine phosphosulfate reductase family protein [Flexilinea flocculi]GAP40937.1 3'-phosphoadenosine 5'-phosphosulfate sulfotransferase [Flexilinea flocculi]